MSLARFIALAVVVTTAALWASPATCSPSNPVSLRVSLAPTDPHPGEVVIATVTAKIDPGWHLYSLVPTPPPGPTPTSFSIRDEKIVLAGAPSENTPTVENNPNFGKQVAFHQNSATFTVPIRVPLADQAGKYPNALTMTYQTCNDSTCLPPKSVYLPFTLNVVDGPIRPQFAKLSRCSVHGFCFR